MPNIASKEKIAKRRSEILDASIEIFSTKGYHATNVADIANLLGIGHGTIYRYYKNKRDIFDAVINAILERLAVVVAQDPPITNSLDEYKQQLLRISDGLLEIFHTDPRLAHILFYESTGVDREAVNQINNVMSLFSRFTQAYLKNGQVKGFLRSDMAIDIAARIITSMIFEAVKFVALEEKEPEEINRWRDEILRFMIGGLK